MSVATGLVGSPPGRLPPGATAGLSAGRPSPSLELVPTGRPALPRATFLVLLVSLLVGGLIGLLMLNTVLARDAFVLDRLKEQGRALADQEQALEREVELLRSPQSLAVRATELGMVQAGPPAFLRLPDGTVLGAPVPGAAVPPGGPR
ncbi:MAG: hypothetical protein KY440_04785 [Actinobacteria bacterium]|nr:hypothetical protein [Actinomycetota bacterium]